MGLFDLFFRSCGIQWVHFESFVPFFHIKHGARPLLSRTENVLYMRVTLVDREPPARPTIYSRPLATQ